MVFSDVNAIQRVEVQQVISILSDNLRQSNIRKLR